MTIWNCLLKSCACKLIANCCLPRRMHNEIGMLTISPNFFHAKIVKNVTPKRRAPSLTTVGCCREKELASFEFGYQEVFFFTSDMCRTDDQLPKGTIAILSSVLVSVCVCVCVCVVSFSASAFRVNDSSSILANRHKRCTAPEVSQVNIQTLGHAVFLSFLKLRSSVILLSLARSAKLKRIEGKTAALLVIIQNSILLFSFPHWLFNCAVMVMEKVFAVLQAASTNSAHLKSRDQINLLRKFSSLIHATYQRLFPAFVNLLVCFDHCLMNAIANRVYSSERFQL